MVDNKEWHKIGDKLTNYFGICTCQRKIKLIIDNLYSIYCKVQDFYDKDIPLDFTGAEWLVLALMNKNSKAVMHGINCEYPIIIKDDEFWKWILEVKDNPNLKDN